jgi:hypothetical protein
VVERHREHLLHRQALLDRPRQQVAQVLCTRPAQLSSKQRAMLRVGIQSV